MDSDGIVGVDAVDFPDELSGISSDDDENGWVAAPSSEVEAVALLASPLHSRSPAMSLARRVRRGMSFVNTPGPPGTEERLLAEEDARATATFGQAFLNSINILAGVGILSLPFAFLQTGWLVGSAFLLYICIVTNYTGKLIGFFMTKDKRIQTYPDIGRVAFGSRVHAMITTVLCIELVASLSMFITLMGDNLHKALGDSSWSPRNLYITCTLAVLPTCWTSQLSLLSSLSVIGILGSFAVVTALITTGFTAATDLKEGGSFFSLNLENFVAVGDEAKFAYAIGLQMVGFAGHAVFPSIFQSLQDKSMFPSILNLVYVICTALYMGMGMIGYLLFTSYTQEELTLNLVDVAGDSVVVNIALWLTIINPFTKFALTLNPLATIVEEATLPKNPPRRVQHYESFQSNEDESGLRSYCALTQREALSKVVRTALVFLSLSLAVFVPSFASICAFLGAFCSFVISAIFPILCYIKIYGKDLSRGVYIGNCVILVINCILCILGTGAAMVQSPEGSSE